MTRALLGIALLLAGCGGRTGAAALPAYAGYDAQGLASWYGEEAAGNRTASGERFDPDGITAAHRTLPLGSYVEVTDVSTGRRVVARVTDRGPGRRDRIIDLSRGAARLLGTDRQPIASVRVRALGAAPQHVPASLAPAVVPDLPRAQAEGRYLLQVASFSNEARATALAVRLGGAVAGGDGLWRVRLGPYDDRGAQRARDAVPARGYGDARILPADSSRRIMP